jgi:hypothetical protein
VACKRNLPRQGQTTAATTGSQGPAGKTPSRVWTLVIVGGLSRYRGTEPNVDVSFDCGPRPDYRMLIVGFRSVRHTLSTASPSGSRPPCPPGSARRRPFAGTPGHVGEMCLTDSSLRMPCRRKLHQPAILMAREPCAGIDHAHAVMLVCHSGSRGFFPRIRGATGERGKALQGAIRFPASLSP